MNNNQSARSRHCVDKIYVKGVEVANPLITDKTPVSGTKQKPVQSGRCE